MLKSSEKNNEINSITSGTKLQGDLVSSGDVRIDGHLTGSVKTQGRFVLGETGIVEGRVSCKTAIISGELKATITSEELLTLRSTSKLSGEITTGQLSVEPGAIFTGKCSMGPVIKKINKDESKVHKSDNEKSA